MIDVYSTEGTFADKHELARDLAAAVVGYLVIALFFLLPLRLPWRRRQRS
jgi:hypothetical protein